MRNYRPLIATLILLLAFPEPAAAYIDPGAGANILAILASGFTGIVVVLKLFGARLSGIFRRRGCEEDDAIAPGTAVDHDSER